MQLWTVRLHLGCILLMRMSTTAGQLLSHVSKAFELMWKVEIHYLLMRPWGS